MVSKSTQALEISDIDECTSASPCYTEASCTNTAGSYTCTCNTGHTGNGRSCTEITCPATTYSANRGVTCNKSNRSGSFCVFYCNSGYALQGSQTATCGNDEIWSVPLPTCTDIDECTSGSSHCHVRASCNNTAGSYICICNTGYTGNGRSCTDRDECATNTGTCHTHASCRNTPGSYICTCNSGYHGEGRSCTDIDECSSNNGNCHADATCSNAAGSYGCTCNAGYTGNGLACIDFNECNSSTLVCHSKATCWNTLGSYTCQCITGYTGDGRSCADVDDCSDNPCYNNGTCGDRVNDYQCTCTEEFTGKNCSDPRIPHSRTATSESWHTNNFFLIGAGLVAGLIIFGIGAAVWKYKRNMKRGEKITEVRMDRRESSHYYEDIPSHNASHINEVFHTSRGPEQQNGVNLNICNAPESPDIPTPNISMEAAAYEFGRE